MGIANTERSWGWPARLLHWLMALLIAGRLVFGFSLTPAYLAHGEGKYGLSGGDLPWFSEYSFQLSRGFRALKAWMSLKEHGIRKYGRLIQQNIDQAGYLAGLVDAAPELELAAPVTLNVVCFRYIRPGLDDAALDALNKQILVELQERGIAAPSGPPRVSADR